MGLKPCKAGTVCQPGYPCPGKPFWVLLVLLTGPLEWLTGGRVRSLKVSAMILDLPDLKLLKWLAPGFSFVTCTRELALPAQPTPSHRQWCLSSGVLQVPWRVPCAVHGWERLPSFCYSHSSPLNCGCPPKPQAKGGVCVSLWSGLLRARFSLRSPLGQPVFTDSILGKLPRGPFCWKDEPVGGRAAPQVSKRDSQLRAFKM